MVVIGVYDHSGLTAREAARLIQIADRAFSHSGIHIMWRHCLGVLALPSGTTCNGEIPFNQIVVNLQPYGARTANHDTRLCMGHASVNPAGGYSASVFASTVREQAAGFGVAFDLLMGYAVAHEVGHCLLGPGHSYVGLMRGVWNGKDAQEISQLSLHLTKQERRRAVARIVWLNQRP